MDDFGRKAHVSPRLATSMAADGLDHVHRKCAAEASGGTGSDVITSGEKANESELEKTLEKYYACLTQVRATYSIECSTINRTFYPMFQSG